MYPESTHPPDVKLAALKGRRNYFYLSSSAINSANRLHKLYVTGNIKELHSVGDTYLANLTKNEWHNFDDIYLGFYALNLRSPSNIEESRVRYDGLVKQASLNILMRTQFPEITKDISFENSLPDEFDVADIALLTRTLRSVIQLPTIPTSISVGCVYLGYSIYASPKPKDKDISTIEWLGFDQKAIESHPFWAEWKERFNISMIEFTPL